MRSLLVFLFIVCISLSSRANDSIDGYVIMANKDTVKCKFSLRSLRVFRPFYLIKVRTETGEEQTFRAKDKKILGYGFKDMGVQYHFWYIEMKKKSESGFYQQLINGPKYKLYTALPYYVLFAPTGDFVQFEACILCPWKKQLRELLKDDTKALELLENGADRNKIIDFVSAINREF
jgi:hypothetical protein